LLFFCGTLHTNPAQSGCEIAPARLDVHTCLYLYITEYPADRGADDALLFFVV